MRSKHHHFVWFLASTNFRNGVVHFHRFFAKRIGHLQFHFHGPMFQHAKKHAVAFAGDKCSRYRADLEFFSADASHVQ